MIPDESFFAMIALCPDLKYEDKIISETKRFMFFREGAEHPISLQDGDENIITQDGKQYYFARKVNAFQEKRLVKWMIDRRDAIDRELGIT